LDKGLTVEFGKRRSDGETHPVNQEKCPSQGIIIPKRESFNFWDFFNNGNSASGMKKGGVDRRDRIRKSEDQDSVKSIEGKLKFLGVPDPCLAAGKKKERGSRGGLLKTFCDSQETGDFRIGEKIVGCFGVWPG